MPRLLIILRPLLLPFSGLYALVMAFRNVLYDRGIKKTHCFPLPVISVGNLSVGGTGKTPHTELLIRLLQPHYRLATLSRGYGRNTQGFIVADQISTAAQIGDEPMQLFRKFAPQTLVTVGEKRANAIEKIISLYPNTQAILLDDAYQHRRVKPSFSILLTDYNQPFYRDYVLPAGRLRENRNGAKRAQVIIATKCPVNLSTEEQKTIIRQIRGYASADTPVFFTGIRYGEPVAFGNSPAPGQRVMLVTGLANAKPLATYVQTHFTLTKHLDFPDHYDYRVSDLEKIQSQWENAGAEAILTTEKDYVKILSPQLHELAKNLPFFYIPIEVYFLSGQALFYETILQHCQQFRPAMSPFGTSTGADAASRKIL